jgi:hypothetical protein
VTVIKSAIIKSYAAATHKATVQIAGSLGVWLDGIRVATDIPAADVVAGRQCTVLFLDPSNQDDAVVITIQGALPSGGASIEHAPLGALYPGVLSTGLKPPQIPYYGDTFTATKLYCRLSVPSQMIDVKVQFKRGVGEAASSNLGSEVTIEKSNRIGSVAISQAVASGDFFEINITQVGSTPNEGSDLLWLVAP